MTLTLMAHQMMKMARRISLKMWVSLRYLLKVTSLLLLSRTSSWRLRCYQDQAHRSSASCSRQALWSRSIFQWALIRKFWVTAWMNRRKMSRSIAYSKKTRIRMCLSSRKRIYSKLAWAPMPPFPSPLQSNWSTRFSSLRISSGRLITNTSGYIATILCYARHLRTLQH